MDSLSLLCYFTFTFPQLRFFLEAIDEDALAFSIAPNASVCALGLRNLSHSEDLPTVPVFLSHLPFLSPSPVMSLVPFFLSSSSLSSEISDNSDDD